MLENLALSKALLYFLLLKRKINFLFRLILILSKKDLQSQHFVNCCKIFRIYDSTGRCIMNFSLSNYLISHKLYVMKEKQYLCLSIYI